MNRSEAAKAKGWRKTSPLTLSARMYQTKARLSTATGRDLSCCARANQPFSPGAPSARFRLTGFDQRHVPHFAARPRRTLAVEMNGRPRHGEPLLIFEDLVPDQVGHGHGSVTHRLGAWPAGNGADVLLELRDRSAVQGPVPRIVHPR